MDIHELRIGNLVRSENEHILFVVGILGENVYTKNPVDKLITLHISDIGPIKITSFMVRCLGLHLHKETPQVDIYRTENGFYLYHSKIDEEGSFPGAWFVNDKEWVKVAYIHELQNYHYWHDNGKKELSSVTF